MHKILFTAARRYYPSAAAVQRLIASSSCRDIDMSQLYEKQVRWKQINQLKAELERKKEEVDVKQQHPFTPKIFTKRLKEFDGSARKLTEDFKGKHVQRQMKARQQKEEDAQRVERRSASPQRTIDRVPLPVEASSEGPSTPVVERAASDSSIDLLHKPPRSVPYLLEEERVDLNDETIIEMLERERLQWQRERLSLISCIELQQRELSRRAVAVHEKAGEIAREFAKTIELFEERLMIVETSVQRELTAMRTLADTMRDAVATQRSSTTAAADIDQRLTNIEELLMNVHSRLPPTADEPA